MGVFLFVRWLHLFLVTLLGMAAADLYEVWDHVVIGAFFALSVLFSAVYYILVERCFTAFRRLKPRLCSYYEPYFWWHERLWKVPADTYLNVFNGTPFKNLIWRSLGVRLGRGVFDDGCYLTERTLVSIGDHAVLNAGSKVQCHSQEDGAFKSGHTTIGADCTLGVGAFVHYGVTMGDGAVLDPDSFLMKGETVPPAGRWGGNPATAVAAQHIVGPNDPRPALPVVRPGGRHRDDVDSPPAPAPAPPSVPAQPPVPAPLPVPAPGPRWAPAPRPAAPRWAPAPRPAWAPAPRWVPTQTSGPAPAPAWAPGPRWVPTQTSGPGTGTGMGTGSAMGTDTDVGSGTGTGMGTGSAMGACTCTRTRTLTGSEMGPCTRTGAGSDSATRPVFEPEPPSTRTQPIGRHHLSVVRRSETNCNAEMVGAK